MSQRDDKFPLTPKVLVEIAKEGEAEIEGTILAFDWGEGEVLLWSANTSIPCPKCERQCKECLVMKTTTGDVYVCLHCEEFVLWNGSKENGGKKYE